MKPLDKNVAYYIGNLNEEHYNYLIEEFKKSNKVEYNYLSFLKNFGYDYAFFKKNKYWIFRKKGSVPDINIIDALTLFEVTEFTEEIKTEEHGLRYNENKLRWSLVDFKSLEPMVRVLEFGAKKYDDHNWKKGLKTTEVTESLLRHTFAFLNGEDIDQESGLSHLGHIMCNAMFLQYTIDNKPNFDTRCKQKDNH